ncbi:MULTISPECIES: tellurite resistance TerB family protein [unclassified Mesorhizobium]|uniref:tellurite resistance TerB family protein n=1 Tax=unclassified Mesorhizobium TaxID=325217 RepID=UPI000FCC45D0|nr:MULTISPECIES: tellurite resistance TerB family protein [unclassified Mesorhizobium]RWD65866.1 MAG: Tellurite resistance protein TerB [Mesorhizobium sp.]RWE38217.1 MAG: Tellurite resistance protein TerB [Mesorhizobium sp.]TGP20548.1 Tellurite resistance protein TerB [Mesorhizobium sp. M1D.F.Ca.ET.231.01.1.1]TGP28545.1 Tellurite resistance protein TerB [Mesorhizobium sp. M1D.F.Ca.ET.234.01.1.1]TGS42693.1 Tellurite resistance protein TerB [Mesorhizobium sp. M1D.F.Ca.ET.184.01.1.1]
MPSLTPHEALIYLMVITSASDRDMTDVELARIGDVVRSWPVFVDFNQDRLVAVSQECQKALHDRDGLEGVLAHVAAALPERLRDTAYAAAFEVAAVDLEMRMEEVRVLQLIRLKLDLDTLTVAAIARAAKARLRTLT